MTLTLAPVASAETISVIGSTLRIQVAGMTQIGQAVVAEERCRKLPSCDQIAMPLTPRVPLAPALTDVGLYLGCKSGTSVQVNQHTGGKMTPSARRPRPGRAGPESAEDWEWL
jgi:hypothetical protein